MVKKLEGLPPMQRLAVVLLTIIAITLAICLGIAIGFSILTSTSLFSILPAAIFLAGACMLIVGGLVGSGRSEVAYYGSHYYLLSGQYREALQKDRLQRRDEQFYFMVIMALVGLSLMGLSAFISFLLS